MILLLSNDDGIQSEGLVALEEKLRDVGEIYTVAPDRAQSSMSHALTLHRPLRVYEFGPRRLAVDGTPVDCVKLALTGLLSVRPDLVIAGINKVTNLLECKIDVLFVACKEVPTRSGVQLFRIRLQSGRRINRRIDADGDEINVLPHVITERFL